MAFMRIETLYGEWYIIDVQGSDYYVPPGLIFLDGLSENGTVDPDDISGEIFDTWLEQCQPYVEASLSRRNVYGIESRVCWGARYSAPGYLDATDWTLGQTEEEAVATCKEIYGEEEEEEKDQDPEWEVW